MKTVSTSDAIWFVICFGPKNDLCENEIIILEMTSFKIATRLKTSKFPNFKFETELVIFPKIKNLNNEHLSVLWEKRTNHHHNFCKCQIWNPLETCNYVCVPLEIIIYLCASSHWRFDYKLWNQSCMKLLIHHDTNPIFKIYILHAINFHE